MKDKLSSLSKYFRDQPIVLIDIGALGGIKTYPWKPYEPHLQVVGFEPQEKSEAVGSFRLDDLAIFNTEGSATMYITQRVDSSSLLKPNQEILSRYGGFETFKITKEITVATDTLDNQINKRNISYVDFIKLDTQGSELHILESGAEILKSSVYGIEVEINFIERYTGQRSFAEIDIFLRENGFELFDIQHRYHKRKDGLEFGKAKGQLTHGTALYLRTIQSTERLVREAEDKEREFLILHYIAISLIYGYHDFALEIYNHFKPELSAELRDTLKKVIMVKTWHVPAMPGRYKITLFFENLAKLFKPNSKTGKTGDRHLGNF